MSSGHTGPNPGHNPIAHNLDLLKTQGYGLQAEYIGRLGVMGKSVVALDPSAQERFDQTSQRFEQIINGIFTALPVAEAIIQEQVVIDPIDPDFTESLLVGIIEKGEDREFIERDIPQLIDQLAERTRLREMEIASLTIVSAEISEGRTISVVQGVDTSKFDLILPAVTDPTQNPVAIGPEAVIAILGAPLTDGDYGAVANLLKDNTEGLANDLICDYMEASRAWAANLAETQQESEELVLERKRASYALRAAVYIDPVMSCDVILNSILISVIREYPQLSYIDSPQPYSS